MDTTESLEGSHEHPYAAHGPPPTRQMNSAVHQGAWYPCCTMAKAKRRKLRARRSKANHGRKPNAGRG